MIAFSLTTELDGMVKAGNLQRKNKVVKYNESWFHKVNFDVMEAYLDKKMEKYNV